MRELRLVQFVLGALVIPLADDPLVPRRLRPGKFPLGGTDRDTGHVRVLLALQDLAAHVDLLAAQVDDQALERGALALEFVLQPGADDGGEQVALLDGVARVAVERDGAGRGRIQRGTDGSHDRGLRRDVAQELTSRHLSRCARDRGRRLRPSTPSPSGTTRGRNDEHEQRDRRSDVDAPIVPPAVGLLDDAILAVGAAHARRGNLFCGSLEGGDGHVSGLDA